MIPTKTIVNFRPSLFKTLEYQLIEAENTKLKAKVNLLESEIQILILEKALKERNKTGSLKRLDQN